MSGGNSKDSFAKKGKWKLLTGHPKWQNEKLLLGRREYMERIKYGKPSHLIVDIYIGDNFVKKKLSTTF